MIIFLSGHVAAVALGWLLLLQRWRLLWLLLLLLILLRVCGGLGLFLTLHLRHG